MSIYDWYNNRKKAKEVTYNTKREIEILGIRKLYDKLEVDKRRYEISRRSADNIQGVLDKLEEDLRTLNNPKYAKKISNDVYRLFNKMRRWHREGRKLGKAEKGLENLMVYLIIGAGLIALGSLLGTGNILTGMSTINNNPISGVSFYGGLILIFGIFAILFVNMLKKN